MVPSARGAITTALALVLAGCGMQPQGFTATRFLRSPAGVYCLNGEAHLIIRRRSGMQVQAMSTVAGVRPLRTLDGLDVQEAAVSMDQLDRALDALKSDPGVTYVEPAHQLAALSQRRVLSLPRLVPNDPYFSEQYGLERIQAPEAWALSRGDGVTIAMIDTGVDTTHPDFAGKLVAGYNTREHDGNVMDDNGHGTHCAGIAAAWANNGRGIAGVAPNARLMPIKALDGNGDGLDVDVADGIAWAVQHGANVISMSLGGPTQSQVLSEAVAYAQAHGVPVVAAAGNDGSIEASYPAAYPGVIAVGASDAQDQVAPFSQGGRWLSVVAPGVQILSTVPQYRCELSTEGYAPNYARLDGTSMAVPAVAGVVALIEARYGTRLSPSAIKYRLESMADPTWGQRSFDERAGYGRVNAARAVQ